MHSFHFVGVRRDALKNFIFMKDAAKDALGTRIKGDPNEKKKGGGIFAKVCV